MRLRYVLLFYAFINEIIQRDIMEAWYKKKCLCPGSGDGEVGRWKGVEVWRWEGGKVGRGGEGRVEGS